MRTSSVARRVLSLAVISWMAAAWPSAAAGTVTGSLTIQGTKAPLVLAYVDESPEDVILVLASKDVPADAVPFIGEEVARKFKIHAIVFTVNRASKKIDGNGLNGIYYPGSDMGYRAMAHEAASLQIKRFDATGIEGRISTPKTVTSPGGETYSFDATFSIPLGKAAPVTPVVVKVTGDTTSPPTAAYAAYYRAAHEGDVKAIRSFMAAAHLKEFDQGDPKLRSMMLDLMKSNPPEISIGKPVVKGTTATFRVEGVNLQTTRASAEVTMVQEAGAWKVDKERWSATNK